MSVDIVVRGFNEGWHVYIQKGAERLAESEMSTGKRGLNYYQAIEEGLKLQCLLNIPYRVDPGQPPNYDESIFILPPKFHDGKWHAARPSTGYRNSAHIGKTVTVEWDHFSQHWREDIGFYPRKIWSDEELKERGLNPF